MFYIQTWDYLPLLDGFKVQVVLAVRIGWVFNAWGLTSLECMFDARSYRCNITLFYSTSNWSYVSSLFNLAFLSKESDFSGSLCFLWTLYWDWHWIISVLPGLNIGGQLGYFIGKLHSFNNSVSSKWNLQISSMIYCAILSLKLTGKECLLKKAADEFVLDCKVDSRYCDIMQGSYQ